MDSYESKTAALIDIARAHVADASELNEIAEVLRAELLKRGKLIQSFKDETDQRRVEADANARAAFYYGCAVGAGVALIGALIVFSRI